MTVLVLAYVAVFAAGLTAGHVATRHRLVDRLGEWAAWMVVAPDNPPWLHARWWIGQLVLAVEGCCQLLVRPRQTWAQARGNWRPEPEPAPVVETVTVSEGVL